MYHIFVDILVLLSSLFFVVLSKMADIFMKKIKLPIYFYEEAGKKKAHNMRFK